MRALLLAALLVAAPLSAQVVDSVPVPYPVAIGGAFFHVLVDWDPVSQHTTLHGALRAAGMEKVTCEVGAAPCDVRVCSDREGDGSCYRMEIRWIPLATPTPEPEPEPESEPEPDVIIPDSIQLQVTRETLVVGDTTSYSVIVWRDDRSWMCVNLAGQLGLLAARREHGVWGWDYPVPEFVPTVESCDLQISSSDTGVVEVLPWAPCPLDEIPTRPAQYRLQAATGSGQVATATLEHTPEPGSLLVAMLWHRMGWQQPTIEGEWTRVALHVETGADVGNAFRKGLSVWVRRAGQGEPRAVTATWSDADEGRETFLSVWELDGYGDFVDATIESSRGTMVDHLILEAPGPGALFGVVGAREFVQEAVWDGLEDSQIRRHSEALTSGGAASSTVLSATGQGASSTLHFGEAFTAVGVLLRFGEP